MSARTSDREPCHKRGVVLTCYVNGCKRFRAVALNAGDDRASMDGRTSGLERDGSSSRETTSAMRSGRPN